MACAFDILHGFVVIISAWSVVGLSIGKVTLNIDLFPAEERVNDLSDPSIPGAEPAGVALGML
jgi:hypothetical protein